MKISKGKTLNNSLHVVHIDEPIGLKDITVHEWSKPELYERSNKASTSARVTIKPEIVKELQDLKFFHNFLSNHYDEVSLYNSKEDNIYYTHISVDVEYSLKGIRKDKQQAVKDKALKTIQTIVEDGDLVKAKVNNLLDHLNKILTKKVDDVFNEVERETRSHVGGEALSEWADKENTTGEVDELYSELEVLNKLVARNNARLKELRIEVLTEYFDKPKLDLDPLVIGTVKDAIANGKVFAKSRFGF